MNNTRTDCPEYLDRGCLAPLRMYTIPVSDATISFCLLSTKQSFSALRLYFPEHCMPVSEPKILARSGVHPEFHGYLYLPFQSTFVVRLTVVGKAEG